jgi:2,3-bisphosphoglycerate-dependent phosphoglycerate mutase
MPIYLVRHGETPLNVARVLQPAHTPLSEHGQAQAQAVATRLASAGVAQVLSSDLPRALQTAQAIAKACAVPIETSPLLQERHFGDLRGQPYDTLGFNPLLMQEAPPGGESMPTFLARVASAFAHLLACRAHSPGPLVVVSHGLVIQALLRHHLRLEAGQTLPLRLGNTSLTHFEASPPHTVRLLDCTAHLGAQHSDNTLSLSGG